MKILFLTGIWRKMAEKITIDNELISGFRPERPCDGHKNTFGTAIICAGSEFMTGAAVMAASAALRSGAGLVKVFSEERTLNAVSCIEPCALLELRPEKTAELLRKAGKLAQASNAVLIGSGIPADYKNMEALTDAFLKRIAGVVLDAGVLSSKPDVLERLRAVLSSRSIPAVMTPHIGEFARMVRLSTKEVTENSEELVLKFAAEYNCVMVLKSYKTLVATPDNIICEYEDPNSGLAKGGSGDILAGLLTGFLAQGMEPYKAACSAVFIHSKAGRAAAEDTDVRYMLPTDILNYLPEGYLEAGWSEDDD